MPAAIHNGCFHPAHATKTAENRYAQKKQEWQEEMAAPVILHTFNTLYCSTCH